MIAIDTTTIHEHVLALTCSGTVTREDIKFAEQAFEDMLAKHERIGIMCDMTELSDVTGDALAEDLRYELSLLGQWHKVPRTAVVTGKEWVSALMRVADPLIPTVEMKTFPPDKKNEAIDWAADLPER